MKLVIAWGCATFLNDPKSQIITGNQVITWGMADKEGAEDELKKLLSNKKGNSALPIQQSLATITDYWKGLLVYYY